MKKKYSHILSPLKIGNVVLKNRIFTAPMGLHALQGGEPFPTQAIITHYANKARGGAAVVTCSGVNPYSVTSDGAHIAYDLTVPNNQHYLAQLADAIHTYGAKASMEISAMPENLELDVVDGLTGFRYVNVPYPDAPSIQIDFCGMRQVAENLAWQCKTLQRLGFDMCMIHCAYSAGILGRFLDASVNTRTDEFSGSMENRCRFLIMCFDEIKKVCGRDFLIELRMSGELPDGYTNEEAIEMARQLEGHIDILHVHAGTAWQAHPMCFEADNPNLWMAEAIKKAVPNLTVLTIGGYQNLDEMEEILASGKADLISIARGWLAEPSLVQKARENRADDVRPCIKCMRCHDSACIEGTTFVCTVNPQIGLEHVLNQIELPTTQKKVAIIGGGPAGMQAALTAAGRGHQVTLYERSKILGGQVNFADYAEFKRALRTYKDWLIHQIEKSKIRVLLHTTATRELLVQEGYDVVIAAIGASPFILPLPGADTAIIASDVYGKEHRINGNIVVIGGGQVGCETAYHLARLGKEVTVIEMQDRIAPDASSSYRARLLRFMGYEGKLHILTGLRCKSIGSSVVCVNAQGKQVDIPCDNVIMASGMRANTAAAMELWDETYELKMVGDCKRAANIQKAVRDAYCAAVTI